METGNNCFERLDDFAGRSEPVASRRFHLFGSAASTTGALSAFVDPARQAPVGNTCRAVGGGLWQITTTAVEYRRVTDQPLAALSDQAQSDIPAGVAPFTRRSLIQLRVAANDGVDTREFEMDANQSITIVAGLDVCVYWLGFANTIDVLNLNDIQRASQLGGGVASGIVLDTFLGVSLSRIEESPGDNSTVVLTKHLFVPAAVRRTIAIPAYAQDVTIYQEPTLGTSSVMWTQFYGDPAGGSGSVAIGSLPFIPGERRTEQESVLPNATHLQSDIDPDFTRFFTLRFTIRP